MRDLFSLLQMQSIRRRAQFLALLAALVATALVEIARIGAVVPVIALAAAPGKLPSRFLAGLIRGLGGGNPLLVACAFLVLAAFVSVALRLVLAWLTHRFVVGLGRDISEQIFARMLRQPYEAYKSRNSSDILTGLEKVHLVIFYVLMPATHALTAVVIGTVIIAALLVIDPAVAGIGAITLGGVFVVAHLATRRLLGRNSRTIATMTITKTRLVQEALGNIRDILIDGSQAVFERSFRAVDEQLRRAQSTNMLVAAGPRVFVEAAAIVALVATTLLAAHRPGGVIGALPALGALALGAQRLLPLLQQVYVGCAHIAGHFHSTGDVVALMRMPIRSTPELESDMEATVLTGDIILSDVAFAFPGAEPVLEGINLRIPAGASVAIVGESGSGKSTLVDIIMGLLIPTSGTITVGGKPLDSALRARWQSRIAHVPQSVYLSDLSISNNIAFGVPEAEIDHERVRFAARAAQAAEFIERLPKAYDTPVGEGGARLSGGERQRIGIARALYKDADVLILDEATSALTVEMEIAVYRWLEQASKTLILVSHRLASVAGCDFIVRIADGRARTTTVDGARSHH